MFEKKQRMSSGPTRPSPSGPRLSGDRYQHLFTWLYGAQMLFADPDIVKIEFEKAGAGNVDDLVVHHRTKPPLYHQIKFVTSQEERLTPAWFMDPGGKSRSPLQRFHDSYQRLTVDGTRPELALLTNRWLEEADVIKGCISGRDSKLTPRIEEGGPSSANSVLRQEWSQHLDISEAQLLEFLSHLSFMVGRDSLDELHDRCALAMRAARLRADTEAITVAGDLISWCVEAGIRELTPETLLPHIHERRLGAERSAGSLLIQCLGPDPWPEAATASLDWVDLFEGDEPAARRQLRDPAGWETQLKPELREAVQAIRRHGLVHVNVYGSMRLSTALFAGSELSRVAGFKVETASRGDVWSSDDDHPAVELDSTVIDIGQGDEIAVGLSIATDLTDDVVAYVQAQQLPVGRLVVYTPQGGSDRESVKSPQDGLGLAYAITDALRRTTSGVPRLHLFQAMPMPLSLMIGHLWNRMPETQLYDDLGAGKGYTPTFGIAG
jgi:hypothetical protein